MASEKYQNEQKRILFFKKRYTFCRQNWICKIWDKKVKYFIIWKKRKKKKKGLCSSKVKWVTEACKDNKVELEPPKKQKPKRRLKGSRAASSFLLWKSSLVLYHSCWPYCQLPLNTKAESDPSALFPHFPTIVFLSSFPTCHREAFFWSNP